MNAYKYFWSSYICIFVLASFNKQKVSNIHLKHNQVNGRFNRSWKTQECCYL